MAHAYNCTVNDATGFSPFFLLFGGSPRLPVDLFFGTSPSSTRENHTEYVKRWKSAMKDAYAKASSNSSNLCECKGPGKLRSYWENQIYEVVEQKGALHIFGVKPEGNAKGRPQCATGTSFSPVTFYHKTVLKTSDQKLERKKGRVSLKYMTILGGQCLAIVIAKAMTRLNTKDFLQQKSQQLTRQKERKDRKGAKVLLTT